MRFLPLLLVLTLSQAAWAEDWLYYTYPGDTPLKIGHDYLKNPADWREVLKINKVPNDRVLPVHTRIRIPVELLKVTPAPVLVTHVNGNVRVKPEGGVFRRLAAGDQLNGGETVLTGPNSFAGFKLADGTLLTEQATSKLKFGRLAAWGKTGMVATELDLDSGHMEVGAAKQLGPAGGFKVNTPIAVAGLRGTVFRLNVSEDGTILRNEVLQGVVGVSAQGKEVLVAKAEGTVARRGQPPEAPRPLLPAPTLDGLPGRVVDLPLHFSWPQMDNAVGWRAQVASDPGFQNILLDTSGDKTEATWQTDLPDGQYFLRVRAIDAAGLEGLNGDHPFELDARPLPPELSEPAANGRAYQEDVTFAWAASQDAQGYLLQIASTAEFPAATTIEHKLGSVVRDTVQLKAGHYFWRMASIDGNGPHGWSPVRTVLVRPLPVAPQGVAKANGDSGEAGFTWQAVDGATQYDFELARNADFADAEVKQRLSATRTSVKIKPGKHFWRIRGVEADGQAGAWSRVNPLLMPLETPHGIRVDVSENHTVISWQGNASAYRLEFARDADFKSPLFNHRQKGNVTELPRLEPGEYWLRIISLDGDGALGGESKPTKFVVFGW
jgi:hypothetical protein